MIATRTETFRFNDGGRARAGFKGHARDCVCRALAIATGLPYAQVYTDLAEMGKAERPHKHDRRPSSPRTGVHKRTYGAFLKAHGWTWTPTMFVGRGCTVHLRAEELPAGLLLVSVSRHLTVMRDGVIEDTHDPSRGGTRCVYGYWQKP